MKNKLPDCSICDAWFQILSKIQPAKSPINNPINSLPLGFLFCIINANIYDTMGVMVVTNTPPAPGIPLSMPVKKSMLYNAINTDAINNDGNPLVWIDNLTFNTCNSTNNEIKVNTKRISAISRGLP